MAYAYLDKNKSLGHLETKIYKTKIMKFYIIMMLFFTN